MKKQYRLATFALSACLLMACGARETNATQNSEAESQTENTSNIDTKIDETETSGALTESESRETPIAPKEITIDFTGVSEFHPEGTAAQPYSLEILSETYNNITFADEWYNATEDVSLPMIGENWDCFYDENYTYQWDYTYQWEDGKLSIFDGENCLYVLEYPTDKWYVNGNNACLENGIFYGASVMNGYAQPDSCFMFAYDLENEKLLWRSADQTYNSMNFLVKGDVIFCGYGFTAEDDYLYQLDKNTGEVIDRLPLKKMPDLMAEKDDRLYVHTYSYDYVIEIGNHTEINQIYLNAVEELENTDICQTEIIVMLIMVLVLKNKKELAYPNEFVIYDINDDGIDELLIGVEGTCNSDSAQYIYRFSEKKEEFELLFDYYYGCRFYENGLIYAPASHSGYTYNDDFWPYEVYRYNEMENMYECIASVEELDLNACPEYKDNFPFKDDKDGDKKIYFVRFYEDSLRLDEGEYNDWKEKLFESDLFELNWHTLS